MNTKQFNSEFMSFLDDSPTPFHAVQQMGEKLKKNGFLKLSEADAWQLKNGGRYFVTRNDSSLIAFIFGNADMTRNGIRMAGAHTDSPCLRIKPQPELTDLSFLRLGVEVYGGALLNPWFDRDLSLAGRVTFETADGGLQSRLINFRRPVAVIPSLAIHLDREANKSKSVNAQDELPPMVLQLAEEETADFRAILKKQLLADHPECKAEKVTDYEISLYDTQPSALTGFKQEFICSARLDNLLSCYAGMAAMLEADTAYSSLLICNDHEEVGSSSTSGAQGPFLEAVLARMLPAEEERIRAIDRSMLISADDAHGLHPNYAAKYDAKHGPLLNRGPVIKVNASQRYASNSETIALFRSLCRQAGVPCQDFVMRSDMACGSTIGPLTATRIGVKTVDVGAPIFAMHSVRETGGADDAFYLFQVLKQFFGAPQLTV